MTEGMSFGAYRALQFSDTTTSFSCAGMVAAWLQQPEIVS